MAGGQMTEVILVEVADLGPGDVGRADPDPAAFGTRARRAHEASPPGAHGPHRLSRWQPLAAALVALVATGSLGSSIRAADHAADVAALPAVLDPLTPPLRELWREPLSGREHVGTLGSDVLVFGLDARRVAAVERLDGATGEQKWLAPLPEVTGTGDVWCAALGDAPAYVACQLVVAFAVDSRDGKSRPDRPARLLVLDARTGVRASERTMSSASIAFTALESDLAVTEVDPAGYASVTRADPVTGEERWRFRSPVPLRSATGRPIWLQPVVQHGVLVVHGSVTWAFAPDGTVLGEWRLRGAGGAAREGWGFGVAVLTDGRFVVGQLDGAARVRHRRGADPSVGPRGGVRVAGLVVQPSVDDGSAAEVLFTIPGRRGGLVAFDSRTGDRVWESDVSRWTDPLVLDGRLIAAVGPELRAVDARTGELLWQVRVAAIDNPKQVLTDGLVVLVPAVDPRHGAVLRAFDPADGRERWNVRLPAGVRQFSVAHGRLLATTDRDVVALG